MSKGTHCWKHDIWYASLGECPRCLAEESAERQREHFERQEEALEREEEREREREREHEEAREREEERQRDQERRHEELVRLREREIYERNNPGDYTCPECLLISLKRGASRCPMCHAAIGHDYWPPIYKRERLQAEEKARRERLAAEEWAKGEPERQRLAKAAVEEQKRRSLEAQRLAKIAAEAKRRADFLAPLVIVYFAYLLPIISVGTEVVVLLASQPESYRGFHFSWDCLLILIPVLNWIVYVGLLFLSGPERPTAWAVLIIWAIVGAFIHRAASSAREASK